MEFNNNIELHFNRLIIFIIIIFDFVLLQNGDGQHQHHHEGLFFSSTTTPNPKNISKSQNIGVVVTTTFDDKLLTTTRNNNNNNNLQQHFLKLFNWNYKFVQNNLKNNISRTKRNNHQNQCFSIQQPLPNLDNITNFCTKNEFFFGMNPKHMEAIGRLKNIMGGQTNGTEIICMAGLLRDQPEINPNIWLNSLMSIVLNHSELNKLQLPSLVEIIPNMFVNSNVLKQARQISRIPRHLQKNSTCVVLDENVGHDNGIENILWYWREDILMNSNHWYWHLTNPFKPTSINGSIPPRPDRRGEMFYYYHHCIMARYNAERLSNGLGKVIPLDLTQQTIIDEPYFAHLDGTESGKSWSDRSAHTLIQDIIFNTIPDTPVNISITSQMEQLQRIYESVRTQKLLTKNNQTIPLNNSNGIDLLGEIVDASIYSVNPNYYGVFGIHNAGHLIIGLSHDPQGARHLRPGVMSDITTAMRDPAFYRFHSSLDDIFNSHKYTLAPYQPTEGEFPLLWQGVTLRNISVISQNRNSSDLVTFWNYTNYDLSRGLDFNRSTLQGQGPVHICAKHLDHEPFKYEIVLEKDSSVKSNKASVRIFLAPKFDEFGVPYSFSFQRIQFFPLDFFTVQINPGNNFISRRSIDSFLTIPWPQSIEELERKTNFEKPNCGCGWPHHLLLPKGVPQGMIFDLFIMVTNGEEDSVSNNLTKSTSSYCHPAPILCGISGQLYPDLKPMGYPFDRLPYDVHGLQSNPRMVQNLDEYTNGITNMAYTQIKITHLNSGYP